MDVQAVVDFHKRAERFVIRPEVAVGRRRQLVRRDLDHDVAVLFMVEPPAFLGQKRVEFHTLACFHVRVEQPVHGGIFRFVMYVFALYGRTQFDLVEAADLRSRADEKFADAMINACQKSERCDPRRLEQRLTPMLDLASLDLDVAEHDFEAVRVFADEFAVPHFPVFEGKERNEPPLGLVEHFVIVYVLINFGYIARPLAQHRPQERRVGKFVKVFFERQAGQHRARIHVDEVVVPHQFLDLRHRHPHMRRQDFDFVIFAKFYDDVAVSLAEKAGGLLGLYLIDDDLVLLCVNEVVEVCGTCAAVLLREVGFCRLDGRRKLDFVDVARLDLRLHQIVHFAVYALADDAEIADLVLEDDGLGENSFIAAGYAKSGDLEEAAGRVADRAGGGVVMPWGAAL